ncbi:MAG TPA: DEAD/DEAH box helicase [Gemmatimonadaceae bacterium]|nr:DEAD/DEAH box helicase [Gemmatimonadaceae bacterium]
MLRDVRDRGLPPDHDAFVAAEPPTGRVIVIAPTRAACETIELALGLHVDTVLEREHGTEVRELAASGKGFGIMAGTGTGKTLAIRPIAESILRTEDLRVGVVNREREATPETPSWNVIIVTTGIARRWFQDGDILPRDTLVVDEIHQTSAELELCLALGKRVGCRFVWLSATVDPTFYARYLRSAHVIESSAFDPAKAATVRVVREQAPHFLSDRFLQQIAKQRRGVAMFLPTRASVEEVAEAVEGRNPRITSAFYHGGEPIRVIRPFLEEGARKPYFLAMTAAGQSALNIKGLDTVVIDDTRFTNVVTRGRNVLTRLHLGANELLQMAGRVHGRVAGGKVYILSDRDINFGALEPTEPEFQLAGDSERIAITCAALGVRADELDLPVPLDRIAYRRALAHLEERGIIAEGRLTKYGATVEAVPAERSWAELIANADDKILPAVAVMSGIESLHRMTREDRNLKGILVEGSDHLTAYNLYAEAYRQAGSMGEIYGLPRHVFDEEKIARWAERRGVLIKAIEDAALAMASVYRSLSIDLPTTVPFVTEDVRRAYVDLVARIMPFDLVIDEELADGMEAKVSRSSVAGSWGAVAGELRFFADRFGVPRASIDGTQIPTSLIRKYARRTEGDIVAVTGRGRDSVVVRHALEYFGFTLEQAEETLTSWEDSRLAAIRRALAGALARGEAHHPAVRRHYQMIERVREYHRRSGGVTARLGEAELAAMYEEALARENVRSLDEYYSAPLRLELDSLVSESDRKRLDALPDHVIIRDFPVEVHYDVDDSDGAKGVARLKLPEKLARSLVEQELPPFDRPYRFIVMRGARGAVRAKTLEELQELLDRPYGPDEDRSPRQIRHRRDRRVASRRGPRRRR